MRILQVTPYFVPHIGGVEQYVYNLSKYLIEKGHQVEVVTSNIPKNMKYQDISGIKVRRYPSIIELLRNPITFSIVGIHKELGHYDIINVHNLYGFSTIIVYLKNKNNYLLLTHHGRLIFGEPFKDKVVKLYESIFLKRILKLANHIVVLSKSDEEFISSFGIEQNKITIIPNAIDVKILKNYDINIDSSTFKDDYWINNDKIVLFVGRLHPIKGVEYLIMAMKRVYEEIPGAILIIVGDGKERVRLENLAQQAGVKKYVKFVGEVSHDIVFNYMQTADIFVLPSLSEGLPTSILEAMCFGLPVISTNILGIRDHFQDVAILVPPKDSKSLAEAILILLNNEDFARELSQRGKELINTRYTWDSVADAYVKIYSKECVKN